MNRTIVANVLALVFAFVAAVALSARATTQWQRVAGQHLVPTQSHRASVAEAKRIVSASVIADELLLEMADPTQILAFTKYSQTKRTDRHRYAGKNAIGSIQDTEAILTLKPDVVFVHNVGDPRPVERLVEVGIDVVDLGVVEALPSLIEDIDQIAASIGNPEIGRRISEELKQRLVSIAADIPPEDRKNGAYMTVVGKTVYGGTVGSSYHTMLRYAGINDVAAQAYQGWPTYSAEDLLRLNPPLIVTVQGQANALCSLSGAQRLTACKNTDAIVELPNELAAASGLGIVDAARAIRNQVYGVPLDGKIEER